MNKGIRLRGIDISGPWQPGSLNAGINEDIKDECNRQLKLGTIIYAYQESVLLVKVLVTSREAAQTANKAIANMLAYND